MLRLQTGAIRVPHDCQAGAPSHTCASTQLSDDIENQIHTRVMCTIQAAAAPDCAGIKWQDGSNEMSAPKARFLMAGKWSSCIEHDTGAFSNCGSACRILSRRLLPVK
jgi:hypothetical protein